MRVTRDMLEQLQQAIDEVDSALTGVASIHSAKIELTFGDVDGELAVVVGYSPDNEWTVEF